MIRSPNGGATPCPKRPFHACRFPPARPVSEVGITPGTAGVPGVGRAAVIGGVVGFVVIGLVVGALTAALAGPGAGLAVGLWIGAFGGVGFGAMSFASYYANEHPE